jgi:FixJ family two-component response regulator
MYEANPVVFVVDDDPVVSVSMKRLIGSVGLQVQTFGSAQDFLRAKLPDAPGCLVLDVRLPDLSGLDLQQEHTSTFPLFSSQATPISTCPSKP